MNTSYYTDEGALVFVFQCAADTPWMTGIRRKWNSEAERMISPFLPLRLDRNEAQYDLDCLAKKNSWDIAD